MMSETRIRAITVDQPWASLLAVGIKHYETRAWRPRCLQPGDLLAIHASKKDPGTWPKMLRVSGVTTSGERWCSETSPMPTGAVLAVGVFSHCGPTERYVGIVSGREFRIGDWSPGRYSWRLNGMYALATPVPETGHQGLWWWTVPETLREDLIMRGYMKEVDQYA